MTAAGRVDPLTSLAAVPDVAAAVARTRAAVDALLVHRALRRRGTEVSAESSVRGAWASAVLAGSGANLAEVRTGAAAREPVVQGALRAQSAIAGLAGTLVAGAAQALARLHALASADLVAPELLGRPTGATAVAGRLDALARLVAVTSAPALVVAAVVHGELLALDAFAPMSGVVARCAVRITLVDRGLDPSSLVCLEVGHLQLRAEYEQALSAYVSGDPDGVVAWVLHCAEALALGARESAAICEALIRG